jgi:hypothetical protein
VGVQAANCAAYRDHIEPKERFRPEAQATILPTASRSSVQGP